MVAPKASGSPLIILGTFTGTTTTGEINVDISAVTFKTGDVGLLFIADSARDDAFTVTTSGSGWTELVPSNTLNAREGSLWAKNMSPGDTSIVSSGFTGTEGIQIAMFFRNYHGFLTSLSELSVASPVTAPDPASTSPYAPGSKDLVLTFAMSEGTSQTMTADLAINGTAICAGVNSYKTRGIFDPPAFSGTYTTGRYIAHTVLVLGK